MALRTGCRANRSHLTSLLEGLQVRAIPVASKVDQVHPKNNGVLPVCAKTNKIAVIGPNANRASAGGGGSASLNPYYNTLPLDSIRQVAGEVVFNQGCTIHKWLPVASEYCMNSAGNHGVDIDWYAGDKFHGKPVVTRQRNITDLFLWDSAPIENVGLEWSAIVKTSLMPTVSGKHSISFMSAKLFE
ncbi:hypothetical protein ACHAPV_009122 [Trichoderma viride]